LHLVERIGVYLPSRVLLEDGLFYWLFEDGTYIIWGDAGMPLVMHHRAINLQLSNRDYSLTLYDGNIHLHLPERDRSLTLEEV